MKKMFLYKKWVSVRLKRPKKACSFVRVSTVPELFIATIKKAYDGMSCKVLHEGSLTDKFEVEKA